MSAFVGSDVPCCAFVGWISHSVCYLFAYPPQPVFSVNWVLDLDLWLLQVCMCIYFLEKTSHRWFYVPVPSFKDVNSGGPSFSGVTQTRSA